MSISALVLDMAITGATSYTVRPLLSLLRSISVELALCWSVVESGESGIRVSALEQVAKHHCDWT